MQMQQRVFVDLDGVVIDSEDAIHTSKNTGHRVTLESCPPIPGAVDALRQLATKYEVHILSTARWSDPDNWGDRIRWIRDNGLEDLLFKRVTLTHNKNLLQGRALIDDRTANGASEFQGEHILFGSEKFPSWKSVVAYLMADSSQQPPVYFTNGKPLNASNASNASFASFGNNEKTPTCVTCGKPGTFFCSKKCWVEAGGLSSSPNSLFGGSTFSPELRFPPPTQTNLNEFYNPSFKPFDTTSTTPLGVKAPYNSFQKKIDPFDPNPN